MSLKFIKKYSHKNKKNVENYIEMIYNKGETVIERGRRITLKTSEMPVTITALRKNECNKNVTLNKYIINI